jgi:hypothetical protein
MNVIILILGTRSRSLKHTKPLNGRNEPPRHRWIDANEGAYVSVRCPDATIMDVSAKKEQR